MADEGVMEPCWLRLTNGWTVSISAGDTPPAICCIAAWPTEQDEASFDDKTLFAFAGDRTDCRCWSLADVREALQEISRA